MPSPRAGFATAGSYVHEMSSPDTSPSYRELTTTTDGVWHSPPGWLQGRGAWGGLLVGAAVRAAEAADLRDGETTSPRLVREVSMDMLGPVPPGEHPVRVVPLRQGSRTSAWRVELLGEGEVLASSSVVFGQQRSGDQPTLVSESLSPPEVEPWQDTPVIALEPPVAPEFSSHLEFRFVSGIPYQSRLEDVVCWVRFPNAGGPADAALLLGMADAMWPATLVTLAQPRPMATITFAASLLVDPATVDAAEPLLFRGRLLSLSDGYATETCELWTPDGRLAVWNTQVIALIA